MKQEELCGIGCKTGELENMDDFDKMIATLARMSELEKREALGSFKKRVEMENQPFLKLYTLATQVGECFEEILLGCFDDVEESGNTYFDNSLAGIFKGEAKVIRVMKTAKEVGTKNFIARASIRGDNTKLSNTSWQQTKPKEFDFLIGAIIWADAIDVYIIDNNEIALPVGASENGKFKLSPQHKGNENEGHFPIKEVLGNNKYLKGTLKFDPFLRKVYFEDTKGEVVTSILDIM